MFSCTSNPLPRGQSPPACCPQSLTRQSNQLASNRALSPVANWLSFGRFKWGHVMSSMDGYQIRHRMVQFSYTKNASCNKQSPSRQLTLQESSWTMKMHKAMSQKTGNLDSLNADLTHGPLHYWWSPLANWAIRAPKSITPCQTLKYQEKPTILLVKGAQI